MKLRATTCVTRMSLGALIVLVGLLRVVSDAAAETKLQAGDDIQAAVDASPQGEIFTLEPGVYRLQTVFPKDGQQFHGMDGAILNGARLLVDWTKQGQLWISEGLPKPRRPHGICHRDGDLCRHREDLFVDDRLFERVASLSKLGPAKWYYQDRTAYLSASPIGKTVELSTIPLAIGGNSSGVVLKNLVVEKYASAAQKSAIDATEGEAWRIEDVTARWNHGIGLRIGKNIIVRGGFYGYNGQMGMGGKGDDALIERVELAHNNFAGFSMAWEAGGAKFVLSDGIVIRDSCIHHNDGIGLWIDIDNNNILIEGNRIFDNARSGVSYEISRDGTIRDNLIAQNGRSRGAWLWGSQILIQNSRNVSVYGNRVEVAADSGNGISVIFQNRQDGKGVPYLATGNVVRENEIVMMGRQGQSGIVADHRVEWFWQELENEFDRNTYYVQSGLSRHWAYGGRDLRWVQARGDHFERNGTLVITQREPMKLSCDGGG